jgi:L-gulonate 3-dehydrogenase
MDKIGIVDAGPTGQAWAIVFARSGFRVAVYDTSAEAGGAALDVIRARLSDLDAYRLLRDTPEDVFGRISLAASLEEAVAGAIHVQDNGPEDDAGKIALFRRMDAAAGPETVLASSTSSVPPSVFAEPQKGRHRCLVVHTLTPPYLVRVVEVAPSHWTSHETVLRTRALFARCGMSPATIKREIPGFALNRMQIALVSEAWRLVADGVVTPEDCDAIIKHGLGLRWSVMGPFEAADVNVPGGIEAFCARYGEFYTGVRQEQMPIDFTPELAADIAEALRKHTSLEDMPARREWRDRRMMALLAHQATQPE